MGNMKTILDLGYGKEALYDMYKASQMSSRLFYGMVEIEREGRFRVVKCSFDTTGGVIGLVKNNLKVLQTADVVFMSYMYGSPLILLSLLKKLGFYRKRKIVGICHHTLSAGGNGLSKALNKLVYSSFEKILFHSQKNMEESLQAGLLKPSQAEFLFWGDDIPFIDQSFPEKPTGDFFLSTGRENRDFQTLTDAFAQEEACLEIYSNKTNYDNKYDFLETVQGKYDNISISFVEKSTQTTNFLASRTAHCKCVVIPLAQEHIHYCLGLTSVVEAMAMGKPVISSRNPYSPIDIEKEGIGFVANTVEEWKRAIRYMQAHPEDCEEMGRRARKLAEQKFNIQACANQLSRLF